MISASGALDNHTMFIFLYILVYQLFDIKINIKFIKNYYWILLKCI